MENSWSMTSRHHTDVGARLRSAFSLCGFAYLTGSHGVPEAAVENLFSASRSFFSLPTEDKDRSSRDPLTTQGYVRPGQEMLDNLKQEPGEKVRSSSRS